MYFRSRYKNEIDTVQGNVSLSRDNYSSACGWVRTEQNADPITYCTQQIGKYRYCIGNVCYWEILAAFNYIKHEVPIPLLTVKKYSNQP
jgi:hypothetical protein